MTDTMRTPFELWLRRIEIILEWASRHPTYDITFALQLKRQLEHFGSPLTHIQAQALIDQIEKFDMENT